MKDIIIMFRQMHPEAGETVKQYITRLSARAKYRNFSDEDDQIRDHIIHTCKSDRLQCKLFKIGQKLNLAKLQDLAQSYEAVEN